MGHDTMDTTLAEGYSVRPVRPEDAHEIVALMAACDLAETGQVDAQSEEDLLSGWGPLDMERGSWLVRSPEGELVAYANVHPHRGGRIDGDVYLLPAHRGNGIGTWLTRQIEARAQELADTMLAGTRVALYSGINGPNEAAKELLANEGYVPVRHFWRMQIALDEPPPAPVWPAGMSVRACVPGQDERIIFDALEEAFQDHWNHAERDYEEWAAMNVRTPSFDPGLWFLALDGDEPAGAVRAKVQPDGGWINTLGVRRPWRKRGLGMMLLRQAFGALYEKGARQVALGVDAQNPTGATRLYEAAGMRVAMRFVVYQKVLREGPEVATDPEEGQTEAAAEQAMA
jgi:mycothiol synthase